MYKIIYKKRILAQNAQDSLVFEKPHPRRDETPINKI